MPYSNVPAFTLKELDDLLSIIDWFCVYEGAVAGVSGGGVNTWPCGFSLPQEDIAVCSAADCLCGIMHSSFPSPDLLKSREGRALAFPQVMINWLETPSENTGQRN